MRIDFDRGEFVVSCTFEERHLPKAAGFKWDTARRKWVTRSTGLAVMFGVDKLTTAARSAVGLDQDIPAPEGLEYLNFQTEGIRYALERLSVLIADQPGLGKGHPISTRLLTPEGWRAIGDLTYGDMVIGVTGEPIPVTGIFERGVIPIYTVTFSDGASIQCDGDHLWTVFGAGEEAPAQTIDTIALAARVDAGEHLAIPVLYEPARMPPKVYSVPPLVAGIDQATCHGIDFNNAPAYPDSPRYDVKDYATGSPSQMMNFLMGVIGSVGRVRDNGCIRVDLVRRPEATALVSTITEIVQKLGGLVFVERRFRRLRLRIHLSYDVAYSVFGYPTWEPGKKLLRRWREFRAGVPDRRVVSVVPCGRDQVRCISVKGFGNLYVAEHCIVTHNTIQGVGVINALPHVRNGLIVTPASLKRNWLKEMKKWMVRKDLSIDICDGSKFPNSDFVIINYDILSRHRDALRRREWDIIEVDESHALKNRDAGRTKEAFGGVFVERDGPRRKKWRLDPIPRKRLLLMSGTPLANKPGDMWTTVQQCDPLRLGKDYETFHTTYCGGFWQPGQGFVANGTPDEARLREFNALAKLRFMIRRLKQDVLTELPEKIRQIVPLPVDGLKKKVEEERKVLTDLLDAYEKMIGIRKEMSMDDLVKAVFSIKPETWEKYGETCSGEISADTPLSRLARARQDLAVAKLPMVIEYVANLLDSGEKVVVFGYHQAVIEGLVEHFRKRNDFSTACIYGKTPQDSKRFPERTRQRQAEMFQEDPFCRLFVGQYTAAGTGWTLTAARHNVFAELTWVPHELLQAEDRIHRIGSEIWETVWAHHLVVEGSLDDTFVSKLIEKMRVIELALD